MQFGLTNDGYPAAVIPRASPLVHENGPWLARDVSIWLVEHVPIGRFNAIPTFNYVVVSFLDDHHFIAFKLRWA